MALQETNLRIEACPIPGNLSYTPQQLLDAYTERLKILSPSGFVFFVTGDLEPTSNVGPWLRPDGQFYVFSSATNRYVPLNISDSETIWFHFGADTPTFVPPYFWLRTTHTPTEADPSVGRIIGWYGYDGTNWVPTAGITPSGPTSARPTNPVALEQFYDTDISVLIWFERGQWRTVAGSPGDTKFVALTTFEEATTRNPGWSIFGSANVNVRGRYISQATKNSDGSSPLTVPPDVAERSAFETYGEDFGVQENAASPVPYPPTISLIFLVKD